MATPVSQFLISVTLAETQAFANLLGYMEEVKTKAAQGASFKVGLDASAMATIESQVAAAVQKGVAKGAVGVQLEQQVEQAVAQGTKKGKERAKRMTPETPAELEVKNGRDAAAIRQLHQKNADLQRQLATTLGTGGAAIEFDMGKIEASFKSMADQFALSLGQVMKSIPAMLDFDYILEKSDVWRQAKQAGLQRPFRAGPAGAQDAARALQNPESTPQAVELAKRHLAEYERHLRETGAVDRSIEMQRKRREKAEARLATMTEEEIAKHKSLLASGRPIGRGQKATPEPMVRVGRRELPLSSVKQAMSQREDLEEVLRGIHRGIEGEPGQRVKPYSKDQIREQLKKYSENPVFAPMLAGVRSRSAALKAARSLGGLGEQLSDATELANALQGRRRSRRPTFPAKSPYEIIADVDPVEMARIAAGEKGDWSKSAREYINYEKAQRKGLSFARYGEQERFVLTEAERHFRDVGEKGKASLAAQMLRRGGEYWWEGPTARSHKGFEEYQRLVGATPVMKGGAGASAVSGAAAAAAGAGAGAAAGGGASFNVNTLADAMAKLASVDMAAVSAGLAQFARGMDEIDRRMMGMTGGKAKNMAAWSRYLSSKEETEQARQREVTASTVAAGRIGLEHAKTEGKIEHEAAKTGRERQTEAEKRDTQLQVEAARARRQLEVEAKKQEGKRLQAQLRAMAGAGGDSGDVRAALEQMGVAPGMGMTDRQLLQSLRSNITSTMRMQAAQATLESQRRDAEASGLPTKAIDSKLHRLGTDLDHSGLEFMTQLGHAGLYGRDKGSPLYGFDKYNQGEIARWQAMQDERMRIRRDLTRSRKLREDPRDPFVLAMEPEWDKTMDARKRIAGTYGDETKAAEAAKKIREEQHGIVNGLKERINRHSEVLRMHEKEGHFLDFLGQKFRSLATYAGVGFLIYRVAGGIAQMVRNTIELEHTMAELQGLMRGQSLSDMLEIKQSVLDTARRFGVEIKGVAQVAKAFTQLGLSTEDVAKETEAAALGGAALNLTPEQISRLMIGAREITGGRMTGLDVIDRIATVMRVSERAPVGEGGRRVSAEDLAVVIERVGSLAQSMQPQSMGVVQAFDILLGMQATALTKQTSVGGQQMAYAIANMIGRLGTPVVQRNLQRQFGLQLGRPDGGPLPLSDQLRIIAKAYNEFRTTGSEKASALLTTIGGPRQSSRIQPIFENMDDVFKTAMESAELFGQAERRAALEVDTMQNRLRGLGNAFTGFMDSLLRATGVIGGHKGPLSFAADVMSSASKYPRTSLVGTAAGGAALAWGASWSAGRLASSLTPSAAAAAAGAVPGTGANAATAAARLLTGTFATMGVITVIVGLVVAALAAYNWFKRDAKPDPIDIEKEKFKGIAQEFGMESGALSQGALKALQFAQEKTKADLGKPKLFEIDDALAETDVLARQTFNDNFLTAMEQTVPALQKIADPAERLAVALGLLRESVEEVDRSVGARAQKEQLLEQLRTDAQTIRDLEQPKALGPEGTMGLADPDRLALLKDLHKVNQLRLLRLYQQENPSPLTPLDAMALRAENAPSAMAKVPGLGGAWKDRILEALIGYGSARAQAEKMREISGDIGYDYLESRRTTGRSLVEGIERAIAESKGDVFRAKERVLGAGWDAKNVSDLPERYTKDGDLYKMSIEEAMKQVESEAKPAFVSRLADAEAVVKAFQEDQTLLGMLPDDMRVDLANLVLGQEFKTKEEALAFFEQVLSLISGIRKFAREDAAAGERRVVDRKSELKAIENARDAELQALETAQARARVTREYATSLAMLTGMGAEYAPRLDDIRVRGDEEAERVRREAAFERREIAARPGISTAERDHLLRQSRITEDRKAEAALERGNLEAEKYLVEQRTAVLREETEAARRLGSGVTGGLRDALSKNFDEAFGGRPASEVLLEPAFASIRERLADNFIDSWFGPNGIFGAQMESLMSVDGLMNFEVTMRQRNLAAIDVAMQAENAAKLGVLPSGVPAPGVIGERPELRFNGTTARLSKGEYVPSVSMLRSAEMATSLSPGAPPTLRTLPVGRDADGVPRYLSASMLSDDQKRHLRMQGATDVSRVWISESGEWMYDIGRDTKGRTVPTHRVGSASGRHEGESLDSYYERVRREWRGRPEPSARASLDTLQPDARAAMEAMLEQARSAGFDVSVKEAARSQERQEWIYANRPGGTYTLSSNHGEGRAIDLQVGGGGKQDYIKFRRWLMQQKSGFKLIGDIDDTWDWGHVEFPRSTAGGGGMALGFLNNPDFQAQLWQSVGGVPTGGSGASGGIADAATNFGPTKAQIGAARRKYALQQLASQAAMMSVSALNSSGGMFGMRTGVNGGRNWANEGATVGSIAGSFLGPWGTVAGGVIGGMLGGIFGKSKQQDTPAMEALDKIERNTRETITAIENQGKLLNFENRLVGVPTTFKYPGYPIGGGGGGGAPVLIQEGNISVVVQGSNDPQMTADAVVARIRSERRAVGNFVPRRR